ncbi:sugar phosphate isomerase/epimerase family protein [Armatimonas rosea]|uniref:Sugar phosphate isomerase/epimerase n=1 Tax=Armatimonas rosea TaxID=685828 RepID=A0A7W9SLX0_ARMRO|nr:sugar phosphate isomerase/epimerase family protein [Armatimonas rosea]MBB6049040.1 sugar phosphate isomerase/epimerase [Armatimonas rosea]
MEATWQIGAFVRPWGKFSFDEALAGVAAAGYSVVGLLGGVADISLALDGMDTAAILARLAAHGLTANLACLHVDHSGSEAEAFASISRQVESAQALGVRYLMTFGADHEPQFARWYAATRSAAQQAEPHGIQVVFKPHGGCTAAAEEIERCFDQIAHPNVGLWYDAGNIIHYTGKAPVVEARRVAARTTGLCAKDCATLRGEVMLEFGEGAVDFPAVFAALNEGGFSGPVMVECCRTGTWEETTASARRNREFLEALRT